MSTKDPSIADLAARFLAGNLGQDEFLGELYARQCAELPDTALDVERRQRCGFPEVIFAPGKSLDALIDIIATYEARDIPLLITRVDSLLAETIVQRFPKLVHLPIARTIRSRRTCADADDSEAFRAPVAVVTAGTSDLPVASEACETLAWMGVPHRLIRDVGVAGPQRLLHYVPQLRAAPAIVVVAGMEGALASVVAGHVACPVFAVPTSIGYGANLQGFAALLSMLNSCAANVAVCNIDAGFKGGFLAGLVVRRLHVESDRVVEGNKAT